jgi:hypothetical protein
MTQRATLRPLAPKISARSLLPTLAELLAELPTAPE